MLLLMGLRDLTVDDFDDAIKSGVVLVDFWAPWCVPCRSVAPILDKVASTLDGRASVAKVDVDAQPELQARYRVMSVPTLVIFKDGQPVEAVVGVKPQRFLEEMVEKFL